MSILCPRSVGLSVQGLKAEGLESIGCPTLGINSPKSGKFVDFRTLWPKESAINLDLQAYLMKLSEHLTGRSCCKRACHVFAMWLKPQGKRPGPRIRWSLGLAHHTSKPILTIQHVESRNGPRTLVKPWGWSRPAALPRRAPAALLSS